MWQERILLRLVEAMYLINKQHTSLTCLHQSVFRFSNPLAYILDPGKYCRDTHEGRITMACNHACERCLTGTRWPPKNHGMQTIVFKRLTQTALRT